uniref:Superoxide dismutase Fe 3ic n=1 Tax=Rhizophora mucronata TaxID=61149 RepID=A0A2P2JUK1_RHIMU
MALRHQVYREVSSIHSKQQPLKLSGNYQTASSAAHTSSTGKIEKEKQKNNTGVCAHCRT